jgi:MFS family permease
LASAAFLGKSPAAFAVLLVAQLLMGAAQASAFPCAVQSLRAWVPSRTRAFASSLLAVGMQVGAVLAAALTAFLMKSWSWEAVFFLYALPGLVWAAGFALSFHNRPEDHPQVNAAELALIREDTADQPLQSDDWVAGALREAEAPGPERVPTGASRAAPPPPGDDDRTTWADIFANRSVWFLCGQQAFRASGYAFFATWFPTFLKETRNVTTAEAGYLQSLVFAATIVGGLASGRLLDRVYARTGSLRLSRVAVGVASMAVCSGLILVSYTVRDPQAAVALIAAGAMAASFAGPCAYVTSIDVGGNSVPQVFGLMNMTGNLAAAATPVLVAEFFKRVPDWNLVLCLFAGIYFAAAACWALVDPRQSLDSIREPA